jgi:hypothetical protein
MTIIDLAARRAAKKAAPEPLPEVPAATQAAIEQSVAQFGFAHSLVGQTLRFYANQGFDHGQRAHEALTAMNQTLALTPEAS